MWIRRRFDELRRLAGASRHYGIGLVPAARRFARLTFRDRFSPEEVFLLGLLDPDLGHADLATCVSKERLLITQLRLNPPDQLYLTEDKVAFYRRCRERGLATPDVLALIHRGESEPHDVVTLRTANDLVRFLDACGTVEFIVKPADGVHGQGIRSLSWKSRQLWESGRRCDPEGLVAALFASDTSVWIIQPTLKAHADLAGLSGTDRLQTARVVTYSDPEGSIHVPIAYLRLIAGGSVFDNFNFGTSGNLVATIDIVTGRLKHVLGARPEGFGVSEHERHPVTGQPFSTFVVPCIADVSALVRRAAHAFLPLRTIGWDVAITDNGPALIEGNVTWDPLPTRENMAAIVHSLH